LPCSNKPITTELICIKLNISMRTLRGRKGNEKYHSTSRATKPACLRLTFCSNLCKKQKNKNTFSDLNLQQWDRLEGNGLVDLACHKKYSVNKYLHSFFFLFFSVLNMFQLSLHSKLNVRLSAFKRTLF